MTKVCYLHVGMGKAGSSAIQDGLARSHDALREHGYLYPDISGNFFQVQAGKPTTGNGSLIVQALRHDGVAAALELVKPFAGMPQHLVLSCEVFASHPLTSKVKEFGAGLRSLGYDTKSLVLFRPQADTLVSSYLQQVKTNKIGDGVTLDTYVAEQMNGRLSKVWDWEERVRSFEEAFGDVTVKWYPALRRVGPGGVLQAVFDWLGLPALGQNIDLSSDALIVNPTPGREAILVLQAINQKWKFTAKFSYSFLSKAERAGLLGTKITLPQSQLEKVVSATQRSNTRLLRRYCPDLSPGAELRLSASVETEPQLDKRVLRGLTKLAAATMSRDKMECLDQYDELLALVFSGSDSDQPREKSDRPIENSTRVASLWSSWRHKQPRSS